MAQLYSVRYEVRNTSPSGNAEAGDDVGKER